MGIRKAKVHYEEGWTWPGKPWPWCSKAEMPADEATGRSGWAAIPHDGHMTNEGNTWCPGVEGDVEDNDEI